MKEEKIKAFLAAIGVEDTAFLSEEAETPVEEKAAEITGGWKKSGQSDPEHLKELQRAAYGKIHGSYANRIKKALGLSESDIAGLDADGLESLVSTKFKEVAEASPDKAAVQEMQAKLAAIEDEKAGLSAKLEEVQNEYKEAIPRIESEIKTKFQTQGALKTAFASVQGFPLSQEEAVLAFMPKLSGHTLSIQEGVLRAVNAETGKLLYNGHQPVDVSAMAKEWAEKIAPKQKQQGGDPPKPPKEGGKDYSRLHPNVRKKLGL